MSWIDIRYAPRDGRELICQDATGFTRVCYPKRFPRPAPFGDLDVSQPGDIWEFFRDEENAPGHSWSMIPVRYMEIPE